MQHTLVIPFRDMRDRIDRKFGNLSFVDTAALVDVLADCVTFPASEYAKTLKDLAYGDLLFSRPTILPEEEQQALYAFLNSLSVVIKERLRNGIYPTLFQPDQLYYLKTTPLGGLVYEFDH